MWKDLSMQQRADLMDIYLSHGITSLDEMRKHYDSRDIDTANAYREGGDIHIKPENRGKFTALKERTGHSATWFKEHGTPAQKKMAIFELNARHWKHGLGGNLFDGLSQPSQQMNRPNIFRYNDGRYVYQAAPDAEEIEVSPINTLLPNPSQWTYQDAEGKVYTPHVAQVDTGSITQDEDTNPLLRAANNYMREAAYRAKDGTLALQGKYTMPAIAASALFPWAGEAFAGSTIADVPATTWANTAMTAGFAGHGLNHAINEGIDGWGDAAMTALEVAPLGRLAKPVWNTAANTGTALYNDMYIPYKISNAINKGVKENAVITAYNRNPATKDIGNLWDYQSYLDQVFPNTKVKDVLWHGSRSKNLETFDTNMIGSNTPIKNSVGMYLSPNRYVGENYGRRGGAVYPILLNTENPLVHHQIWGLPKNGINVAKISPKVRNTLLKDYDAVIAPERGEIAFFNPNDALILGSDADVAGFREFVGNTPKGLKPGEPLIARGTPEITAENASSITPEQWTAAQDAAIARGDVAEAQRLRDLHQSLTPTATSGKYYRGTKIKRNSYPDRHIDEEVGEMNGIYLTKKPKYAKTYGDVEEFYLRSNNPLETEGSWTGIIDDATRAEIENAGYDAVVNNRFDTGFLNKLLRNSRDETITFNGKNLKSADAVTFDDNGVRIPLGERDNFNINDIRYGLLPFGIGLTGYGLWNNKEQE